MRRKFKKTSIYILLFLVVLVFTSCKMTEQQEAKSILAEATNSPQVQIIKNMTTDEGIKLGDLFDSGMSSVTYELYDLAEDGNTYVTISGNITYKDVPAVAKIQYKKIEESKYEFHTIVVNDIPVSNYEVEGFFQYLYDAYEKSQKEKNDDESSQVNTASNVSDNKSVNLVSSETKSNHLNGEKESKGVLVEANCSDWIFLDGKSICDGKNDEMECDLNGDGNIEIFSIDRDHPNGTKVLGIANQIGQNFAYDNNLDYAFDEFGELNENYGFQVTCYDLDHDNIKEVLVSIGDQLCEMQTNVYRFTNSTDKPFEFVGNIDGQEKMYIIDNGSIEAPFGSQGLFTEYKYVNKKLYEVDENGTLKVVNNIIPNEQQGDSEITEGIIENQNSKTIHIGDIVSTPGYVTNMIGEVTDIQNGKYKVYWCDCVDLAGASVTEEDLIRMSEAVSGVTLYSSKWCEGDTLKIVSSAY